MSKSYLHLLSLTALSLTLAAPTTAQAAELASAKKGCDAQYPNKLYHDCKKKNNCASTDTACKKKCNASPEVQEINKQYDACVSQSQSM